MSSDAVLAVMAEDAFEVLNWARRLGMKREQQLAQVVSAFKKTLYDTETAIAPQSQKCELCGTESVSEKSLMDRLTAETANPK